MGAPVLELVADALRSRRRACPDERLGWNLWAATFVHGVNLTPGQVTTERWRLNFRVQGWFCSDASGGQVFVPAGAPLPSGVNYQ